MPKKKSISFLMFLSCLLFITACLRDEFTREYNTDIVWTPTYNGPVAYGNLTLKDLLDEMLDTAKFETDIEIDEDTTNLYYVAYSDHVASIRADEWMEIPDQDFPEVFFYRSPVDIPAVLLGSGIIGDTIHTNKTKNFEYTFDHGERIDNIFLKSGNLNIDCWSELHHTGYLVISSSQITIGDDFYCDTVVISDTTGNFEEHTVKSLNNTAIRLDNQINPDTTFLQVLFDLYIINSGKDIKAGEQVLVDMSFAGFNFQSVFGYFGDYDTVLIDGEKLEFEIFEGEFSGNVYFGDPRFNLFIDNSFGLPLGVDIFELTGYSEKTGLSTDVIFNPGVNPFIIQAPDTNEVGQLKRTKISIDTLSSNIDMITNTTLTDITYSVRAFTDIGGGEAQNHFILDSSRASVDFEVVLPMYLRAEGFSLEDTVDFNLSDLPDENDDVEIKSLQIRMETKNGMPVDIDMQVVLVDSTYRTIDSLFNEDTRNVLPSGIIDSDGKVIYPSEKEIVIDFSSDRIDRLRDTRHALVNGAFETAEEGQQMVKFYSYYEVGFKMAMKVDASLKTSK